MSIKSTAIFDFLLKIFQKLIKFITQSYLSLLNSFLFSSRFSVSLKSLDNYFFRWFAYKSLLLTRFSVLISYNMCSSNHFAISSRFPYFSRSRFFRVRVQGPGSRSRSRVRVWVQGLGPGPGPGSRVRVQLIEVAYSNMCGKKFQYMVFTFLENH